MPQGSPETLSKPVERVLALAENAVYTLVGLLLVAGALAALVVTGYHLVVQIDDGALHAVEVSLDGLLFVFILLELLAGLRATMVERQLVAEPFLIVGIIASIKEIVITALQAKAARGKPGDLFEDAMTEIGVLGGLVVALALASFLVRRKEREPEEAEA